MTAQIETSKQQTVEQKKATESVAWAGVKTRTPSEEERIQYALNLEVRYQGQLVTDVVAKSAAAKVGIEVGDIILMMGEVLETSRLPARGGVDAFLELLEG